MLRRAVLAAMVVPAVAHADCAVWGLSSKVLNGDNQALPANGGIVVAAIPDTKGTLDKGDASVHADWRFKTGQGPMKPEIVRLAPGLSVYHVPVTGPTELVDGNQISVGTVRGKLDKRAAIAAPKLTSITFESSSGRRSMARVVVTLAEVPPAGTLGLIIADARTREPKSFGLVDTATPSAIVPYLTRDCLALPNGTLPSKAGDKVIAYFVDGLGQLSRPTKTIAIVPAP